ncbi:MULTISPECIES: type I restriction endonuclease [unclassified Coleofasciculus]|uniref:type I restriction endonuclease n=1 Tax=unclassified Coleofasciculus TaxID=2692782 RepID=UPI00187F3549|nr:MULTISPECIES: type I restriction endonuclease [unclassified Coleofasciculus]MBE9127211.1 restriction endonuclease subunit R [Coleofasciculus sp. LEGE 07081]MBE9150321.1 restriction endonuclease subunit R [Coleofasciculus sp. LEGE 07092]
MTLIIQAQDITLSQLTELFGLTITYDDQFFTEWLDNLPELTDIEKQQLDRVKRNYISLIERHTLSENLVKMVVVEHLLDLADFYLPPFDVKDEKSVELSVLDEDKLIRGRLDFLVFKNQVWFAVIESKNAGISLREALPQCLAYMLNNPQPDRSIFGLLTNGDDFVFVKLTQQGTPKYALSDKFTLWKRENELYKVLSILKKLGQLIS